MKAVTESISWHKKEYGNVDADEYVEWFRPFAASFHKALADNGSLVIDIGGFMEPRHTRLFLSWTLVSVCFPRKIWLPL